MNAMITIGGILAVSGLAGLVWCIRKASWLRKVELEPDSIRAELNRLIFGHMAAIGAAFLGLGLLVVGLILK